MSSHVTVDRCSWGRAFLASSGFIVGMLATMAAGLYPNLLPARGGRPFGLTIHNAASSEHALAVGLRWWSLGILLAVGYFIVAHRFMFFRPEPTLGSERARPAAR